MYEDIKQKFAELENRLADGSLMKDREEMIKVSQAHAALKSIVNLISTWEKIKNQIAANEDLIKTESDPEIKDLAQQDNLKLKEEFTKLSEQIEDEVHPANPQDKKNAIIEIRAGTGGDEAALFAGDLFRMYTRFSEQQGFKLEMIEASRIGIGGFKEVIFSVIGPNAYGLLKYEGGTHRVQRVPETEKQGRVHTSTATVVVLPEAEEVDIEIKPSDIRIDTFCSSGPGGQSVNTTYSAIRILHLPTGIIVSCQDQKSQHQNKEKALQVLRSRLLAKQEEERQAKESSLRKNQVGGGDRSDKIRTYNFPQDRITDHRINMSWHSINRILEGELKTIIDELRKAAKQQN
ncbi:MAG: peptide chain release factor 1 [Patescibacteria group bacterium]